MVGGAQLLQSWCLVGVGFWVFVLWMRVGVERRAFTIKPKVKTMAEGMVVGRPICAEDMNSAKQSAYGKALTQ